MASTNLSDILEIDPSQVGKAAAANTAFQSIDAMLNGILTLEANMLTSPFTIPYADGDEPSASKPALRFVYCKVTGALTAPFTAYMPAGKQRLFIVDNQTTGNQDVTFMVQGQTGVIIPPGTATLCFLNADDVYAPPISLASGTQPYDIGNFIDGAPTAGQVIMRFIAARTITFPANFVNNQMKAATAASGTTTFDVNKNGSLVGAAVFAGAGTTATWSTVGGAAVTFNVGDVCTFVAPASPDATLASLVWSFAGTR
jgi:hypothetical protein